MQDNQGIWFPDVDFFERVIIRTIPVLFPNYEGGLPDFQYLGGLQGAASLSRRWLSRSRLSSGNIYTHP